MIVSRCCIGFEDEIVSDGRVDLIVVEGSGTRLQQTIQGLQIRWDLSTHSIDRVLLVHEISHVPKTGENIGDDVRVSTGDNPVDLTSQNVFVVNGRGQLTVELELFLVIDVLVRIGDLLQHVSHRLHPATAIPIEKSQLDTAVRHDE